MCPWHWDKFSTKESNGTSILIELPFLTIWKSGKSVMSITELKHRKICGLSRQNLYGMLTCILGN